MSAVTLTTSRLELRPFTAVDLDEAHALWTEPAVRRYLWHGVVIGRATAAAALHASARDFAGRGFGLWRVHDRASGACIGFCGCRTAGGPEPELVYGLRPAWWGQGLAVEASAAVLDHVFFTLLHTDVVAATDPPNLPSLRVMEKLGMSPARRATLNGLDTIFYRLARATWRRHRGLALRSVPGGTAHA